MHPVESFLLLSGAGVGGYAAWQLGLFGERSAETLVDRARQLLSPPPARPVAPTLATYTESLFRSLLNPQRRTFWGRCIDISGRQWVILAHPADVLRLTVELDVLVADLSEALSASAAARRLSVTLPLDIIQVLGRDEVMAGAPQLVTYASARVLDMGHPDVREDLPAEHRYLMEPSELASRLARAARLAPNREHGPVGHLRASEGEQDVLIPVMAGTTIGRDPRNGAGFVDVEEVSRLHAELVEDPEGVVVVDRGSLNGLWVNGHKASRHLLEDGDLVGLGSQITLRFDRTRSS